jgi:hypothetical protein
MRILLLVLVCYLLALNAVGQDTLYLKSGEFIPTTILEISPSTVSYKRLDNIDGPIYKLFLYQITKIKYQNGKIEFFKNEEPLGVLNDSQSKIDTSKIMILKTGIFYKGLPITNKGILKLIWMHPESETKTLMLREHKQLRRNNRNRILWLSFGISSSAMIPFYMYLARDSRNSDYNTTLGSAFVYSFVFTGISQICNYRYHKKKKHIIATYNNF